MSKVKKIIIYLGIVLLSAVIFFSIIFISSRNQYPKSYLESQVSRLKSSIELRDLSVDEKEKTYVELNKIENLIAQKKEPITTNNKIQNLYSEIIQIKASKMN